MTSRASWQEQFPWRPVGVGIVLVVAVLAGPAPGLAQGAQDGSVAGGTELYETQRCSLCHAVAGTGNGKGPLDGVGSRLTKAEIQAWIVSPAEMSVKTESTRKPAMPSYAKLSEADVDALVAYMMSLTE